ncbi:hypothetical protein PVAG01_01212 [Phlyctema vagabunda]|uniref:Uncharacterized protein n=1 Tax=Phlyctema vagabunda TaxID=108571 RepID=A0ABR4PWY6_9HELO
MVSLWRNIRRLSDVDFLKATKVALRKEIQATEPPMSRHVDEILQPGYMELANGCFRVWEFIYVQHLLEWSMNQITKVCEKRTRWSLFARVRDLEQHALQPLRWTMRGRQEALHQLHYTIYRTFKGLEDGIAKSSAKENKRYVRLDPQEATNLRRVVVMFSKILEFQSPCVRDMWAPIVKLHVNFSIYQLADSVQLIGWDLLMECAAPAPDAARMDQVEQVVVAAMQRMDDAFLST